MSNVNPYVAKLFIYPIKSLDRINTDQVTILNSGALKCDRQFALFDQSGRFVNGKRYHQIHAIRSDFDLATNIVSLQVQGNNHAEQFSIEQDVEALESWFSEYFGFSVEVRQNQETGFPDDLNSPGPTIISTATLETVTSWYPELDVEAVRLRFRANIEIAGVPAFWEDKLFADKNKIVNFQIGDVQFMGINPCQRCVVVTRNPQTGEDHPNFQKTFVANRKTTLPEWSNKEQFNHFFRLAINTRIPVTEAGKTIRIGDPLLGVQEFRSSGV